MTTQDVTLASIVTAFNIDTNNQVTQIKSGNLANGTPVVGQVPTYGASGVTWQTPSAGGITQLPLDNLTWVSGTNIVMANDRTIAPVTTTATYNAAQGTFTGVTLSGFTYGAGVYGITATGQSVTGLYNSTLNRLESADVQRSAGFVDGQNYTMTFYQGKSSGAGILLDIAGVPTFFNELGPTSGISFTQDTNNPLRALVGGPSLRLALAVGNTTSGNPIIISPADYLLFYPTGGTGTSGLRLQGPTSVPTSYTITLPSAVPTANSLLQSDVSGNTSWSTALTLTSLTSGTIASPSHTITQVNTTTAGQLIFNIPNASNNISIAAPTSVGASYSLTLPSSAPGNNNLLQATSGGVLSWSNVISVASVSSNSISTPSLTIRQADATTPGSLIFNIPGGTNAITWSAPATGTAAYTLTLPAIAPTASSLLQSTAAGALSWTNTVALTSGTVANAPAVSTDIVRLTDLQAVQVGLKPQNPASTIVHIAELNVAGTYTNNTGVGTATLTGTAPLTVAGATPATNDYVVLVAQTAGLQNGSYVVVSNPASGTFNLQRTNVLPTFGNFWLSTASSATNYGVQYENVTTGTIVVGTTAIVYAKFGVGVPATSSATLQQVLTAGKTANNSASNQLTLFSDVAVPIIFQNDGSGNTSIKFNATNPMVIGGLATGSLFANPFTTFNIYTVGPSDALQLNQSRIRRNSTGDLLLYGGTAVTDGVILGNNSATATNVLRAVPNLSGSAPTFTVSGTDTDISLIINAKGAGSLTLLNNQTNYFTLAGSAASASAGPQISVIGGDTNINLRLAPKGTGAVQVVGATGTLNISETTIARSGTGNLSLLAGTNAGDAVILGTNNATTPNNIAIFSATAGSGATITAQGTDTNLPLNLSAKGTSVVNVGTNNSQYLSVDGSAAGILKLTALSSATNAQIQINGKGSSLSASNILLGTNFANYWSFAGAATPGTGNPTISCQPAGLANTTNIQISGLGAGNVILANATQCAVQVLGNQLTQSVLQAYSTVATNCGILIAAQGTGNITFGDSTAINAQLQISSNSTTQLSTTLTGGGTNVDYVISAKGTGTIIAQNGLALNSGTTTTPAYAAPLFAANDPTTPTAMTAGKVGLALISRGASKTPNWGPGTVGFIGWYTASATTTGTAALDYNVAYNALGLTTTTTTQISGFDANGLYQIELSAFAYADAGGTNPFNAYVSITTTNAIQIRPAWNRGSTVSINHTGTTTPATDTITSTYVGYLQGSQGTALFPWGYVQIPSGGTTTFINYIVTITRIS